jgi:acetyl esterase/lipase
LPGSSPHRPSRTCTVIDPEALREKRRDVFEQVYGSDREYCREQSPWTWARLNADKVRGRTLVRVHVGSADGLLEKNRKFHELLDELGVKHDWSVIEGASHDPDVFFAKFAGLLPFYGRAFGRGPGTATGAVFGR